MIRVSGQSKSIGLLKRRVWSHVVRGEIKNCTPLWRKAHFKVKMYKTRQLRSTFWSSDVGKLHAAVAKSTFVRENVQDTSASEHFLKFWCRKIARRCGEKRICKWKCTKHVIGALFEKFWCRKIARRCGQKHISKSKCYKTDGLGTVFEVSMSKINLRVGYTAAMPKCQYQKWQAQTWLQKTCPPVNLGVAQCHPRAIQGGGGRRGGRRRWRTNKARERQHLFCWQAVLSGSWEVPAGVEAMAWKKEKKNQTKQQVFNITIAMCISKNPFGAGAQKFAEVPLGMTWSSSPWKELFS